MMPTATATAAFHTTRWTLVVRAQGHGEEARVALSELCSIYYEPVVRFARRWCRGDADRAADLAHGFFADLLARKQPGAADPLKGRFRSYLLAAVKHWLMKQHERESAGKRGGGVEHLPLDEASATSFTAEWDGDFDRAWALAIIQRAHDELRAEMTAAGKERAFNILHPWLDGGTPGDPVAAAAELNLSANALKVAIHRLRERFREKVRQGVAATVDDPAAISDEFRHLVEVLVR